VRKRLGRGELKIIEGADHMTTLIKPEFGAALMEFLRSGTLKGAGGRG
jgi:pimeloyl-ACP methyl ester carboxylesterase